LDARQSNSKLQRKYLPLIRLKNIFIFLFILGKAALKNQAGFVGPCLFSQIVANDGKYSKTVPKVREISSRNLEYSFKASSELLTFMIFTSYIFHIFYFESGLGLDQTGSMFCCSFFI
jgi:hypothetical protein